MLTASSKPRLLMNRFHIHSFLFHIIIRFLYSLSLMISKVIQPERSEQSETLIVMIETKSPLSNLFAPELFPYLLNSN